MAPGARETATRRQRDTLTLKRVLTCDRRRYKRRLKVQWDLGLP